MRGVDHLVSAIRPHPAGSRNRFLHETVIDRSKITRLTPVQGFCASTGGAIMLFVATYLGIPVSTTHTVTGSVIGVGAARKVSAVRWRVATDIVIAWIITLPAAALIAAGVYALSSLVP